MLSLSPSQRIFLALEPVDMRKHFDGVWALASEKLQEDIPSAAPGSCYLNRLKVLCWDGSGAWVLAKRLEKGRFSWPAGTGAKLDLESAALTMLLSGIDLYLVPHTS